MLDMIVQAARTGQKQSAASWPAEQSAGDAGKVVFVEKPFSADVCHPCRELGVAYCRRARSAAPMPRPPRVLV